MCLVIGLQVSNRFANAPVAVSYCPPHKLRFNGLAVPGKYYGQEPVIMFQVEALQAHEKPFLKCQFGPCTFAVHHPASMVHAGFQWGHIGHPWGHQAVFAH
jgi:hypothetical protein